MQVQLIRGEMENFFSGPCASAARAWLVESLFAPLALPLQVGFCVWGVVPLSLTGYVRRAGAAVIAVEITLTLKVKVDLSSSIRLIRINHYHSPSPFPF